MMNVIRLFKNMTRFQPGRCEAINSHVERLQSEVSILERRLQAILESAPANRDVERLKSRLTILDGKLNIALYGLPRRSPLTSRIVTDHVTQPDPQVFDVGPYLVQLRGDHAAIQDRYRTRLAALEKLSRGVDFRPRTYLDLGCGDGLVTKTFLDHFSSIALTKVVDFEPDALATLRKSLPDAGIQTVPTDVMSALNSFDEHPFDLITANHVFEHLSPNEQLQFLVRSIQTLTPGGMLYIETQNVLNLAVLRDYFWMDPQHLRPFSVTSCLNVINSTGPNDVTWGVWSEDNRNVDGQTYYDRADSGLQNHDCLELFFLIRR